MNLFLNSVVALTIVLAPQAPGRVIYIDKPQITTQAVIFSLSSDLGVTEPIQDMIRRVSNEVGVDSDLMLRIAKCESGFNPLSKNKGSTASGVYQFIKSTWVRYGEGSVFDPLANITAAVKLVKKNGTRDWLASSGCWAKITS